MDFGSLLHAAQANEHRAKQEPIKCYRSKFSPPKKEGKSKTLSVNIKKFLARKEEEEKQRELDARKKRDDLLALRSQDGKAKKRVAAMLKRTKAANKSAIEDAVDDDNTAVTINGPSQPDEDDYGYVSQEASAYYNKLMDKYNSAPAEEPLFSQSRKTVHNDLNSTKDRVRMALLKEEEEEMLPHKRKRKSKSKKEDDPGDTTLNYSSSDMRDFSSHAADDMDQEPDREPPPKPKPKRPAPPPMGFYDLLKLAEKKQFEPIKIEPKRKPEDEEERPMTKKQKLEYMKELDWKRRKEEAKASRDSSAQNKSLHNIQKVKIEDEQPQGKQNGIMERSQERQIKTPQQMRIPKINSAKRDDIAVTARREDTGHLKRDEKYQKNPRPSGNYGQDSSSGNFSKSNIPMKDKQVMKPSTIGETVSKSRMDVTNNSVTKISRGDNMVDRFKSQKYDCVPNSTKHMAPKSVEGKNVSENSIKKSAMQSGYDRKLQEAIMAKMEETKKNSEIRKKVSSTENIPSKTVNKSFDSKNKFVNSREYEKTNTVLKTPSKLAKPEQPPEVVHKPNNVKQSQEISKSVLLNKSKTVPSLKPKEFASDVRTKNVSSTSKQITNSDKVKQTSLSDGRERLLSSDMRYKNMPPPKDKQLPMSSNKVKQNTPNPRSEKVLPSEMKSRQLLSSDAKSRQLPPSGAKSRPVPPSDVKPRPVPPSDVKPRQVPPSDVKPRQFPPSDVKSRQFPPSDVRPRQFPPPDVRSKQFPSADVKRKQKPVVKRRITDSDEEYDSEMDDFIDDDPVEQEDVSKHIREIFGYDKRRYSRIDDEDDQCMESNYASILKEEYISKKTGIMEDLEDIRREKEMEKRKKAMKKRKL